MGSARKGSFEANPDGTRRQDGMLFAFWVRGPSRRLRTRQGPGWERLDESEPAGLLEDVRPVLWTALCMALFMARPAIAGADTPPDVVKTRAGGLIRGTIVEKDPDGDVLIQTATGDLRRISMSEVEYAGPAQRGAAKPPDTEPEPDGVRLELRASEPHIAFQQYAGSASSRGMGYSSDGLATYRGRFEAYDAICIAPCTARLPRGTLRLGLAKRNRETAEADPIRITESGTLVGTYTDRQGTRTAGWILGIGSGVLGLGLITAGILDAQDTRSGNVIVEDAEPNYVLLGTGLGVGLVGGLVGFILTQIGDQAEIRYRRR